jgi:hypothetical protein
MERENGNQNDISLVGIHTRPNAKEETTVLETTDANSNQNPRTNKDVIDHDAVENGEVPSEDNAKKRSGIRLAAILLALFVRLFRISFHNHPHTPSTPSLTIPRDPPPLFHPS